MPHLAELVKLHKDREFALIGINAFDSREDFARGVEDFGVSWSVAYQGAEEAPICDLYRVRGYPTILVLDADGRIVAKGLSGEALDRKVSELLDAMERGSR